MADVIQKSGYEVVIEGTSYSMVAVPEASSALVTKQKDRVLRNLKLDKLISNLMRAGELLFLAYNGVAGPSKEHGELRAGVTKISDKLGVLTADCEATMQAFEQSANQILNNLRDCFKFLLQGKEQWAITWLGKASTAATDMATKADGLAIRFDELGNSAVETLGKTQIVQGRTEEAAVAGVAVSAMFWRQMAAHCKELASSDLKEKVTMFMTEPPEQRLVFFLDEDFKLQVVTYLAGWKAVAVIATDYGVTCGRVRAQIQEDFVKNPNTEAR
jgi:hypothetical protein